MDTSCIGGDRRSHEILSNVQNNCPSQNSKRLKTHHYKKNDFLGEYFDTEEIDGKIVMQCKKCDHKPFVSRSHDRMIHHIKKLCPLSNFDSSVIVVNTPYSKINKAFMKAIIVGNWSFASIGTPEFKEFIELVKQSKDWRMPLAREIPSEHLPNLSREILDECLQEIRTSRNSSITVMFDHWTDKNHRSFLGVIVTLKAGKRLLLDLRDVSLTGHSASVTVEELHGVLRALPSRCINSIVSDSAAACKKAREIFVEIDDFKHVVHHRCLAHLMNLVGSMTTCANESISAAVKLAIKAVGTISGHIYWVNYIKNLDFNKPQKWCETRWYSTIAMISGLIDLKDVINEHIVPKLKTHAAYFTNLNWSLLNELLGVLKPLCECIGQVEAQDVTLGESVKSILDYAKQLFNEDHGDGQVDYYTQIVKNEARKAFLHYFNESYLDRDELGLYTAAYAMDRRFKFDYMTEDGIKLCFEALASIAIKSGATLEQVKLGLKLEFDYYRNFELDFVMAEERPVEYWFEHGNVGMLPDIGLRLAYMKSSSANIERTFSTIKYIQGDHRLNLSRESLLHSTRAKIFLKDAKRKYQELQLDLDEECAIQKKLDKLSLNESCSSDDTIITLEGDSPKWIEDQSTATKKNYQSFFTYFDFSRITEVRRNSQISSTVTKYDLKNVVEQVFQSQPTECVIVDSCSEIQVFDDMISDSYPTQ